LNSFDEKTNQIPIAYTQAVIPLRKDEYLF